jgi:hypothetical protein
MEKDIKEFGIDIIQETHQKWMSNKNKYDIGNYGFGVFYSPIYFQPDLMIIGYNVGGSDKDFNESECLTIPKEHEYILYDYKLARIQKYIWGSLNRTDALKNSIKLNLNFFRSKNISQWRSIPKEIRTELENFCSCKVKAIISKLEPKLIIAEGMQTYDELLGKVFGMATSDSFDNEIKIRNRRMRIFTKISYHNKNILGIAHPSGCRLSVEDIQSIISNLRKYI